MKKYVGKDRFNITGRGLVICVVIPEKDLLPRHDEVVDIDGKHYKVRAVEVFWKLVSPPIRGEDVGLVVSELTDDERFCSRCGADFQYRHDETPVVMRQCSTCLGEQ